MWMHVFVFLVVSICQAKLNFHDTLSLFSYNVHFLFYDHKRYNEKKILVNDKDYTLVTYHYITEWFP